MTHPLLTKVLADTIPDSDIDLPTFTSRADLQLSYGWLLQSLDPAIADRLEAALDVCQRNGCGAPRTSLVHRIAATCDDHPEETFTCHAYQPLVTP